MGKGGGFKPKGSKLQRKSTPHSREHGASGPMVQVGVRGVGRSWLMKRLVRHSNGMDFILVPKGSRCRILSRENSELICGWEWPLQLVREKLMVVHKIRKG